jgi:Flp pilus assembly protein TadD
LRRNLGLLLGRRGDRGAAIAELRLALAKDAKNEDVRHDLAAVLTNMGVELAKRGEHRGAVGHYREAIELEPDEWRSHFNLGLALLELREPDAAVKSLERAAEIEPSEQVASALASAIEARSHARADAGARSAH